MSVDNIIETSSIEPDYIKSAVNEYSISSLDNTDYPDSFSLDIPYISQYPQLPTGCEITATAGASGAIFGIAGLLLCIVLLSKGHFEEITLRQLIFMMFFTLYHGFAESGVNNCAHIVGAIIGFVCGIIIFCSRLSPLLKISLQ